MAIYGLRVVSQVVDEAVMPYSTYVIVFEYKKGRLLSDGGLFFSAFRIQSSTSFFHSF